MTTEIKIPDLGDGIESGDVLEVFVNEGDTVAKGQDLIELETDKATVTVPATVAGTISKIHVAEGDTIAVGGVIVSVEASGAAPGNDTKESTKEPASADAEEQSSKQAAKKTDSKKSEPKKSKQEPVAKQPAEEEVAEEQPVANKEVSPAKEKIPVKPAAKAEPEKKSSATTTATRSAGNVAAGPAIRRLAREVGIDLASVMGSGEFGRITRDDLMKAVREGASRKTSGKSDGGSGQSDDFGSIRIEKMPRIRQTIARKMHESWETCPRVTNFDDADITDLEEIRDNSKKDYAARNIKLTTMPFVIKAVAMALKAHPVINASVDLDEGQIIYKEYVNIGIAIDTERGLVVPALRDVDNLGIPAIARQLSDMAENVRNNDFSIEDLRGGTFTISNLGAIGGTYSTPIINVPETAILLIGRSRKMPVVIDDEIVIRLMMPLSISYDHRLIDGGAAARFLNDVKGYLEAPSRLLLAL